MKIDKGKNLKIVDECKNCGCFIYKVKMGDNNEVFYCDCCGVVPEKNYPEFWLVVLIVSVFVCFSVFIFSKIIL